MSDSPGAAPTGRMKALRSRPSVASRRSWHLPTLLEPRLDFKKHPIPVEKVARPAVMRVDLQRELRAGSRMQLRNEIPTVAVVRPLLDGDLALLALHHPPDGSTVALFNMKARHACPARACASRIQRGRCERA